MGKQSARLNGLESGYKNVYYHEIAKKWVGKIRSNSELILTGYFDSPEEAHTANETKRNELQKRGTRKSCEWAKQNPDRARKSKRKYANLHQEESRARSKLTKIKLKEGVVDAYGGKCVCCGERRIEFLTIDHIKGREISKDCIDARTGHQMYAWLKRNDYPKSNYRLLCFNCNSGRGCYRYCPHDKERAMKFMIASIKQTSYYFLNNVKESISLL